MAAMVSVMLIERFSNKQNREMRYNPSMMKKLLILTCLFAVSSVFAEKAAALLYPVHPPLAAEREISLAELAAKAIEILAQDKEGLFLMAEGSQIDWMGHQNNGPTLVLEVVDFDDAVNVGLTFAEQNGETLALMTADHETGGFGLLGGSVESQTVEETGFVHKGHTATMVPLFAFGPGSDVFHGVIDHTEIGKTMIRFIQASD